MSCFKDSRWLQRHKKYMSGERLDIYGKPQYYNPCSEIVLREKEECVSMKEDKTVYRYGLKKYYDEFRYLNYAEMVLDDEGDWVPYDEHLSSITDLEYQIRAEIEQKEVELQRLKEKYIEEIKHLNMIISVQTEAKKIWMEKYEKTTGV